MGKKSTPRAPRAAPYNKKKGDARANALLRRGLGDLRVMYGLPEPVAPVGAENERRKIIKQDMYLGSNARVTNSQHERFNSLGQWFFVSKSLDGEGDKPAIFWDKWVIPEDGLLNNPDVKSALALREKIWGNLAKDDKDNGSENNSDNDSEFDGERGNSNEVKKEDSDSEVEIVSFVPRVKAKQEVHDDSFGDDSDIEFVGEHPSSDTIVGDNDEDMKPSTSSPRKQQERKPTTLKGHRTKSGTANKVAYYLRVYAWVRDNEKPKDLDIPISKGNTGTLQLDEIKEQLGKIEVEAGQQIHRYVFKKKDSKWKPLLWSIPFPIKKKDILVIKLAAVKDLKNWQHYKDQTFAHLL
ncbi:hypothetical protein V5O48_012586 [Marasmius crinis-equi]|uniref:Uncharacterized protein n=1 Tax=Marasmius crinis-equi TaxID=585013 RepID=A0ABR3F2F8_9AGAR